MDELHFRGRDLFHPSWWHLGGAVVVLVAETFSCLKQLGTLPTVWLVGLTFLLGAVAMTAAFRGWTKVGAAGITIFRGLTSTRTYSWPEIRWVEVRETRTRSGASYAARITLANGRRRSLPGLAHSSMYPAPNFAGDYQRLVNWWMWCTPPEARFQPPKRLRDRLSPTLLGVLLGLVILALVIVGVGLTS